MQRKSKLLLLTAMISIVVAALAVIRVNTYYTWERRLWVRFASKSDRVYWASRHSPLKPYLTEYDFTTDWFTYYIPVWEKALSRFKGQPNIHYLEIGLWEGRSALWMLENVLTHPSARLIGVDLFSGAVKERYLANIKRSGSENKVATIIGYSQVELRKLPIDSFDIVYIDGSHTADDVLEDAVLSWRLLKKGGSVDF